jgi:hypothetical protein
LRLRQDAGPCGRVAEIRADGGKADFIAADLAGDEASFVHGAIVDVDGGRHAA